MSPLPSTTSGITEEPMLAAGPTLTTVSQPLIRGFRVGHECWCSMEDGPS